MKKKIQLLLFCIIGMVLFSCSSTATSSKKKATDDKSALTKGSSGKASSGGTKKDVVLTEMDWLVESLDTSFWPSESSRQGKMFMSIRVKYKGPFTVEDIASVIVISPDDLWVIDGETTGKLLDHEEKDALFIVGRLACGEKDGAVPLGIWDVSFEMKDGRIFDGTLDVSRINGAKHSPSILVERTEANAKKSDTAVSKKSVERRAYVVPVAKNKGDEQALAGATIQSVSRDNDSIEIIFTVKDSRIKNGYFWFDVPGEKYYKDSGSMVDGSGKPVNGCRQFSNDGKTARFILRKDSENSEWFNKAVACYFVGSNNSRVVSPNAEYHRTVSHRANIGK